MTAAALVPLIAYTENGVTTAFALPFRFARAEDLIAVRQYADGSRVTLALGSAYSVTGGTTDAGGTLTVTVAAVAGTRIEIRRVTPRSQQMDYRGADTFPAESHEAALDKLTLIDQEQDVAIGDVSSRAIMVPAGETGYVMPSLAARLAAGVSLFGTLPGGGFGFVAPSQIAKGDPGGNMMAVGLFAVLAALLIPLGTDLVHTSGHGVRGQGAAFYTYDPAVDAAYVAVNPRSSVITANGRGFRLDEYMIYAEMFGAVGDDAAENGTAINAAIRFCRDEHKDLWFESGIYRHSVTLDCTLQDNLPITLYGRHPNAPRQHGSVRTQTILRWTGGATHQVEVACSGFVLEGVSFDNVGSATNAVLLSSGGEFHISRCSFVPTGGTTKYSVANIFVAGPWLGYSTIEYNTFTGNAPWEIIQDATGTAGGGTRLDIHHNLADGGLTNPCRFLKVMNASHDILGMEYNTFNAQWPGSMIIIDTGRMTEDFNTPQSTKAVVLGKFIFNHNEGDVAGFGFVSSPTPGWDYRPMYLFRCKNIEFEGNQITGSNTQIFAELVECTGQLPKGNRTDSLGVIFHADAATVLAAGLNDMKADNTRGILNGDYPSFRAVPLNSGVFRVKLGEGDPSGITAFRVTPPDGAAYSITLSRPLDSNNQSSVTPAQLFELQVANTTGAALGALTLIAPVGEAWKHAGPSPTLLPTPATGFLRSYIFRYEGSGSGVRQSWPHLDTPV